MPVDIPVLWEVLEIAIPVAGLVGCGFVGFWVFGWLVGVFLLCFMLVEIRQMLLTVVLDKEFHPLRFYSLG